jgi:adenylate cyclase class IV/catechol 2,3-dioxygenase-like lactoylglutathione lyase family enzyme
MKQGLGLVSLVVRDYDEAIAFFVGILGFALVEDRPVVEQNKRWVVVAPPGSGAHVLLARAVGAEQEARIGNQTGSRVFLFLYTDDFARDHRLLESRGVKFVRPPKEEPYGTVAVFADLYGNLWDLVQMKPGAGTSVAARNVEIKARVRDLAEVEQRARALAAEGPVDLEQDDTFFACPNGRLKLRELADGRGELIHYLRADTAGPRTSDYRIVPTTEPKALREALTRACGPAGRVRKRRRLYVAGRTRIHLDQVEELGAFVELEVVLRDGENPESGNAEARRIMALLGIEEAQLVRGAYVDLEESR